MKDDGSPNTAAPAGTGAFDSALFEAVLASTSEVVYALDRDWRFVLFNSAAEDYFGGNRNDVLGRKLWDLFPSGRGGAFEAHLTAAMHNGVRGAMAAPSALRPGREVEIRVAPMPNGVTVALADVTERRAAERALAATTEHYHFTIELNPQVIWTALPDGQLDSVSERWLTWTGDDGLGDSWGRALHAADLERSVAVWMHVVATGQPYNIEHRVRHLSGEYRWIRSRAWPRRGTDGTIVKWYGITEDIHERKIAEETLQRSEASLRLATEAAEIGTWDYDPVADVLIWSATTRSIFGVAPDEPVSFADFGAGLHPDDRESTLAAFATALDPAIRASYNVGFRIIGRDDGVVRWVSARGRAIFDADGYCVRAMGTAIDITARKATDMRLRTSEAELRRLNNTLERRVAERTAERDRAWRNSRDLLLVVDQSGVFHAANPAWKAVLGWNADEVIGRNYLEFIHGDDHPSSEDALHLASDGTLPVYQNRYRHKDGSYRWISWVAAPEGELIYASGRDVTAERQRTDELKTAQEALRQSQKMEAMGQLTGGVAHDFNNLLTPIMGVLDRLHRQQVGSEREQRLIAGAAQSAERAKTLVQRLLAFARRQPLQLMSVDIAKLVTEMADLIASTTGPQIKVVVDVSARLPSAKADPNQLEMALLNLAVNARDAMPEGGVLRITAQHVDITANDPIGLNQGSYIQLSVSDSGIGMDEATRARAIEPFFSTKGVGKGTGLGLSMAHGLVSQLGGTLTIRSSIGVGTNVELWLPESPATTYIENGVTPADLEAAAGGNRMVLLVDDEELVRFSTADMLMELGYKVAEASSAADALKMLASGLRPDLIVTDHLMPGMSGTELANALLKDDPTLKVVIVSGYAESDGAVSHLPRLTKPFVLADLATTLAALNGLG